MTRRLAIITAWLLVGHAVAFGLFWTLLQVPESSTLMLATSALVGVMTMLVAAAVQTAALSAWRLDSPVAGALRAGIRRAPHALVAAMVFALVWWLTSHALAWHVRLGGQIDAAIIARTGSPTTAWLHAGIGWLLLFLRWPVGLALAVSMLGALARDGVAALGRADWVGQAIAPRRLLRVTLWLVVLIVLPWWYVDWRPARLSLAVEPWFVGAKLTIVAVLMAAGWALVLREGRQG